MKNVKRFGVVLGTGLLLLTAITALGQQKEPSTVTVVSPATGQGEKTPFTLSFVNSEFAFEGKAVKGAPYAAEAVTETTQILSDGNRIVNRSTATLYRDSEGRTRREQSLRAIAGVAAGVTPLQTIM